MLGPKLNRTFPEATDLGVRSVLQAEAFVQTFGTQVAYCPFTILQNKFALVTQWNFGVVDQLPAFHPSDCVSPFRTLAHSDRIGLPARSRSTCATAGSLTGASGETQSAMLAVRACRAECP